MHRRRLIRRDLEFRIHREKSGIAAPITARNRVSFEVKQKFIVVPFNMGKCFREEGGNGLAILS